MVLGEALWKSGADRDGGRAQVTLARDVLATMGDDPKIRHLLREAERFLQATR